MIRLHCPRGVLSPNVKLAVNRLIPTREMGTVEPTSASWSRGVLNELQIGAFGTATVALGVDVLL